MINSRLIVRVMKCVHNFQAQHTDICFSPCSNKRQGSQTTDYTEKMSCKASMDDFHVFFKCR